MKRLPNYIAFIILFLLQLNNLAGQINNDSLRNILEK